ncbi:MAG: GntR family transcriptional regulator [Bacteroidales bacterium]|nr:GntR family transcriptional regulator [Bacteroidales bacterium]
MNLHINHNSPVPMHLQVEELLRNLIQSEEFQNGKLLPREVELAKRLGISRNTIRQATNKLQLEGLIERKKGVGTRVLAKNLRTKLDNWYSFTQEMNNQGVAFINYLIESGKEPANKHLAQFFNITEGSEIVKLVRLRGDAGGPFVWFESYFHPRTGITPDEDFTLPLYELLENKYHTVVKTSREELTARKAGSKLAHRLQITADDPVLIRSRYVFDPGGRPVEYNIGYYTAEKFTYSIEITR